MRTLGKTPGILQLNFESVQTVSGPVTLTDDIKFYGPVFFYGDGETGTSPIPVFEHLIVNTTDYTKANTNNKLAINKQIADYYYQPLKTSLTAIGALTPAADKLSYFTGASTAALTTITSIGRDVISQTSVANLMDYLSSSVGEIWTANNDGHTSGLNADLLDGYHVQGASGTTYYNVIPKTNSSGYLEVGQVIDFHNTSGSGDYSVRLDTKDTTTSIYINNNLILTAANYTTYAPTVAQYNSLVTNANGRVSKSGDTMAGNLKIRNAVPSILLVDNTHYASAALCNQAGRFRIFNDTLATGIYNSAGTYDYNFNLSNDGTYITLMDLILTGANQGTVTFKGDVCAYSDIRLKENISTIENATNIVKRLRGVNFDWKDTGRKSVGVIAQEVELVLPELVYENENGVKSVAYDKLVAVLIEAIKELAK